MTYRNKGLFRGWSGFFVLILLLVVSIGNAGPLTRAQIGELFIFGFSGTEITPNLRSHLLKTCPGSLVLFRRNLVSNTQTMKLNEDLQSLHRKCSSHPLFLAIDQEGGEVSRIPFDPPLPSPWALGQTNKSGLVEKIGIHVGKSLRRLGFNMNLAPVLDLGSQNQKSFVGSRSFGVDPKKVGEFGSSFSLGLIQAKVIPVAKHFPGLGPVPNDPHKILVRSPATETSLEKNDLRPFQDFTQLFPSAMMPSHLIYSKLSNEEGQLPGTFSKQLLQDLLRDKLQYRGLIISDDLLMEGGKFGSGLSDSVVKALEAGVDLVMVSWSPKQQATAIDAVEKALQDGQLSEELLIEKIDRIQKMKALVGRPQVDLRLANKQLILSGNRKYSDLTSDVLKENLRQQVPKMRRIDLSKGLGVWPQDDRLRWQVERALDRPTPTGKKPQYTIAFVKTRKQAREINGLSVAKKKNTIVVNQLGPGQMNGKFATQIDLFLDHPMLAAEVTRHLKKREPANRELSQNLN